MFITSQKQKLQFLLLTDQEITTMCCGLLELTRDVPLCKLAEHESSVLFRKILAQCRPQRKQSLHKKSKDSGTVAGV